MSDPSFTAATLELAATIDDLRQALPKPPITEMSRAAFDKLSLTDQAAFVKSRGRIYDAAPPAKAKPELPDGQIRRSDFDKLGPAERHKMIRGGSMVVD
jgi:hypothetical protein